MPSQRRVKVFALLAALTVLSFIYLSSAGSSTRSSAFYTRTSAALDTKHQEALDLENHQKIQEAHEAAEREKEAANIRDPDLAAVPGQTVGKEQKPFAVDVEEAAEKAQKVADTVKEGVKDAVHGVVDTGDKSVAGRKMIKGEKGLKDDGVAKVGNTGAQPTNVADHTESEEEHKVEVELNSILKKSPSTFMRRLINYIITDTCTQSSSFPRAVAHTRKRQRPSCSSNTTSYPPLMSRSSICTPWDLNCRQLFRRRPAGVQSLTFWSTARALAEVTISPAFTRMTSWFRPSRTWAASALWKWQRQLPRPPSTSEAEPYLGIKAKAYNTISCSFHFISLRGCLFRSLGQKKK